MENKQEKVNFSRVLKEIRDDIEDGKMDETLKQLQKENPVLFFKAEVLRDKNKPLPPPPIQELPE